MVEVLEIQESLSALGYDPGSHDGKIGPLTLAAAVELSHSQGWFVSADKLAGGDVTPEFIADLLHLRSQLPEPPKKYKSLITRVGAWSWGRQLNSKSEAAVERASQIGLSDIDIFVTPDRKGEWATRISMEGFVELAEAYKERGITVHATVWAHASKGYLREMANYIDYLHINEAIESVTLDTEHALSRAYRRNPECIDHVRMFMSDLTLPISVTGYGFATSADRALVAGLLEDGHKVQALPQAYSVTHIRRSGKLINNPPAYQPGTAQRNAAKSWAKMGADNSLMGLACYKQPKEPEEWLTKAFERAQSLGVTQVRYWDLANMSGAVEEVLTGLCAGAALQRKGVLLDA
tara:strand:+ start:316 stop:1365 length:1050 start_codon:yes stop_codon:yes gene_type:complete